MNKNKNKGKRYEYEIRDLFKSIGYEDAIISSSESYNADSMGIDILNIPYVVQCKNGYPQGIKYLLLIQEINKRISKSKYKDLEIIIFHKRKKQSEAIVTLEFFESKIGYNEVSKFKYFSKNYDRTVSIDAKSIMNYLWIILKNQD